jgi:hypothetical protein
LPPEYIKIDAITQKLKNIIIMMYYDKTRKSLLDLWEKVGLLLADNEQE